MTVTTIIAILLAVLLGMAIMVSVNLYYRADNLLRSNKSLHGRVKAHQASNKDPNGSYTVKPIVATDPEYQHLNGKWGVCRMTCEGGFTFLTTIKVFTDEDDEFNLREAQELCEKLNEK